MTYRRKLIGLALSLQAINKASAREKSIRHVCPGTVGAATADGGSLTHGRIGPGLIQAGGSMNVVIEKSVSTGVLSRLGSIGASVGWTARRTRSALFVISGKTEVADVR